MATSTDSPYDPAIDDYSNSYEVYRLPADLSDDRRIGSAWVVRQSLPGQRIGRSRQG
jgi:hypothetical protein